MDYLFASEQTVRVKKTLDVNVSEMRDLLGTTGVIVHRYRSGYPPVYILWYTIRFASGREEPFEEEELDFRYVRRKGKQNV